MAGQSSLPPLDVSGLTVKAETAWKSATIGQKFGAVWTRIRAWTLRANTPEQKAQRLFANFQKDLAEIQGRQVAYAALKKCQKQTPDWEAQKKEIGEKYVRALSIRQNAEYTQHFVRLAQEAEAVAAVWKSVAGTAQEEQDGNRLAKEIFNQYGKEYHLDTPEQVEEKKFLDRLFLVIGKKNYLERPLNLSELSWIPSDTYHAYLALLIRPYAKIFSIDGFKLQDNGWYGMADDPSYGQCKIEGDKILFKPFKDRDLILEFNKQQNTLRVLEDGQERSIHSSTTKMSLHSTLNKVLEKGGSRSLPAPQPQALPPPPTLATPQPQPEQPVQGGLPLATASLGQPSPGAGPSAATGIAQAVPQPFLPQGGAVAPQQHRMPDIRGGKDLLRAFDVFGVGTLPQSEDLTLLIERIRNVARRRPTDLVEAKHSERPLEKLRAEARFAGVTEVAYKEFLCKRDSQKLGSFDEDLQMSWDDQIKHERRITELLDKSWQSSLTEKEMEELTRLLESHPPLSNPKFLAQLVHIYSSTSTKDKELLLKAMRKIPHGVNSRRLGPLCEQAFALVQQKLPQMTVESMNFFVAETVQYDRFEEPIHQIDPPQAMTTDQERSKILSYIDQDLAKLDSQDLDFEEWKLKGWGASLRVWDKIASVEEAKKLLKKMREVVQNWQGPIPKYYHAANMEGWKGVAEDSVLVAGGAMKAGAETMSHSGAYVSTCPEWRYGPIVFAFSSDLDKVAQTTVTQEKSEGSWYGANRAIPVNPLAQVYKRQCWDQICEAIKPPSGLNPIEQRAFRVAVMLWLENWTTVKYDEKTGWQFAIRSKSPTKGGVPSQYLEIDQKILQDSLKEALKKGFPTHASYIDGLKIPDMSPQKPQQIVQPHDSGPICAVFTRGEDDKVPGKKADISREDVQRKLQSLGFPPEIKVFSWTIGALWSFYSRKDATVTRPLRKRDIPAGDLTLNPEHPFF
jgi:hypothetical protein